MCCLQILLSSREEVDALTPGSFSTSLRVTVPCCRVYSNIFVSVVAADDTANEVSTMSIDTTTLQSITVNPAEVRLTTEDLGLTPNDTIA